MLQERNIACLILNQYQPLFGGDNDNFMAQLGHLYPHTPRYKPTRKGVWTIHTRYIGEDGMQLFDPGALQDGFCAVYQKKAKPEAIFCGTLDDLARVENVASELTTNMLEPKKYFGVWPPKSLNSQQAEVIGAEVAMFSIGGVCLLGAMDLGYTIMQRRQGIPRDSINIMSQVDALYKLIGDATSQDVAILGTTAIIAGSVVLLVGGMRKLFSQLGKAADSKRNSSLQPYALDYYYGNEATNFINDEFAKLARQRLKQEAWKISGAGVDKQEFSRICDIVASFAKKY